MGSRVMQFDLLGVYLGDTDDELAFNQEVGQPICSVSGPQLLAAATWAGSQDAVRRWPTTLHAIDPTKVREEIYGVIRPGRIADFGSTRGRYQPLKLAVWPKRRDGKRHLHH